MLDLKIKNGTTFIDNDLNKQDIGIKDGKIVELGEIDKDAKHILDAKGLMVLPGCLDTQVHFREPGSTDVEDLESGSKAAVLGGITSPTSCNYNLEVLIVFIKFCQQNFSS